MMNLAFTGSLQSAKPQRRHINLPLGAERLLWVPAAILALGVLKKYAAPSTEHLSQISEGTVAGQHHPDLLTRIREAGW